MSKISTYEVAPVPKLSDKLIGTSVGGEIEDVTYNFTLQELLEVFLPVIPANNLQGILDYGNTATQDINLFGTITTTNLEVTDTANLFITYLNEETHIVGSVFDSADSVGTAGQVLTSTGEGVEWYTLPPIFTPNLQQVLEVGNTAEIDILLDANIQALDISSDTANVSTQLTIQGVVMDYTESVGAAGQVLSSTSSNVEWVSLPVYSATSPLLFNSSTGVFSIQVANSTQNGYLSFSDWITFNGKQNAGSYITALTGEATATGPGSVPITLNNASVINKVLTGLNITGGNVVATDSILTAFGKVQNQINGLMGGVQYQGIWDANTNTPTLTSSVGTQGYYYIVSVAGTTNLNGITDWQVGDWAIFSGGAWQKVDNTDSVTSVNGQTGAVSLTTDNIPEGVTNLYFLNSRARAAVSATSPLSYNNTTGVFSLQQASGTQNGYLSSTDWTTFNNKQNYLGGTGLVKSTSGTITYITDNSGNWNTAYNDSIVSAAVTGTSTKTLTLNQQDGGTIQASWSDADTGLTSVGLTMPSAFSVANSPLTSNGTIGVTGAGTTAEYIRGDGSLATFPSIISEAQNLVTEVYNSSGATLTKGTVVYINGGQGNLPTITKAIATGDPTSAQTYGVVRSDITNMNNGYVVVTGRLGDLDTRDYTPGQQLYLSSTTAGAWTPTKQYAPAHLVYVGIVVRAHPTQGVVEILIQNGFEMDELHNVAAQNPDNNDILQYKTSTNLWTKVAGTTTNIAEGTNLYYTDLRARGALSLTTTGTSGAATYDNTTGLFNIPQYQGALTNPITGTGTSGQVAYFNGTNSITSNAAFAFTPTSQLLVNNSVTAASAIARGANFTPTLTAAANNDVLVGLDINPTFTNGAFTGLQNTALRVNGSTRIINTATANDYIVLGGNGIYFSRTIDGALNTSIAKNGTTNNVGLSFVAANGGNFTFIGASSLQIANFFGTSGNTVLGSGSDAGFRLDVNGTARVQGVITGSVGSGTLILGAAAANNPAIQITGYFTSGGALSITNFNQRGYDAKINVENAAAFFANGISNNQAVLSTNAFFKGTGSINFSNATVGSNVSGVLFDPTITAQVNTVIYAFRSTLAAATDRWNLFMSGSANNYLEGNLGIGSTSVDSTMLRISRAFTSTLTGGILLDGQISSTGTGQTNYFQTTASTAAASFTAASIRHINIQQGTFGAGSTVTNQFGVFVGANMIGGTSNYGFFGDIPSGTGRWNLYMSGTANNYMAGSLGIGNTSLTGINLYVNKNITGSTSSNSIYSAGAIQSDVTNSVNYFRTAASTQAATFTLGSLFHFSAVQGTFGAGSSVTDQYGFYVDSSLIGATNDYGFYGNIASGTGRWNLYMGGTASNYLAGTLAIGNTNTTYALDVNGVINTRGSAAIAGVGLSMGYLTSNYGWIQSFGSVPLVINASGNNVVIGGTSSNASARLQIDSTTSGFLPPRMTLAQRTAISSPATGLIVYQTDGVEGLWLRTSTGWVELTVV